MLLVLCCCCCCYLLDVCVLPNAPSHCFFTLLQLRLVLRRALSSGSVHSTITSNENYCSNMWLECVHLHLLVPCAVFLHLVSSVVCAGYQPVLLDLGCGKGGDLGKWLDAGVGQVDSCHC